MRRVLRPPAGYRPEPARGWGAGGPSAERARGEGDDVLHHAQVGADAGLVEGLGDHREPHPLVEADRCQPGVAPDEVAAPVRHRCGAGVDEGPARADATDRGIGAHAPELPRVRGGAPGTRGGVGADPARRSAVWGAGREMERGRVLVAGPDDVPTAGPEDGAP